jgi:NAD(P)-dependent dehydrogenase (short-subunit alcohol dehydrogenase family)
VTTSTSKKPFISPARSPTTDTSRLFDLSGSVAVVTGSGRGLGRVLALGIASYGADIVVADVDEASANETAALVVAAGRRAVSAHVDVSKPSSCERLFSNAARDFGHVDVLINNAGIDIPEPIGDISPKHWARVMAVDLNGPLYCSQQAARLMATSGGGSIVNVSSIAGEVAIRNLGAYSAAKAGLNQLTRVMALEWAGRGIRVNAIAPGYLENVMPGARIEHADPAKEAQIAEATILGRRARLDELVGPVVFLASSASSYVTGTVLFVDGGWTAQ